MDRPRRIQRRSNGNIRVADVAAAAGVSSASVSRALNGTGPVSAEVRKRIQRVAEELGYVPNGAAKALATQRTQTIGVIVPTLENSNFAIMAESAQRCFKLNGYQMLVSSSDYSADQEREQIRALVSHGVDGLILVGAKRSADVIEYLQARRTPFVVTWTLAQDNIPSVGFDNAAAAERLVSHLLDLGHTQIGVIAGLTTHNDRATDRLRGVRAALEMRGLNVPRELLIERPYRIAEGQIALRALLELRPRPTAVFCGNDQLAFGALIECSRQKIDVPRELSIVGFDDLEYASQIIPSLTTIRVPAEDIGLRAAELLLARLSGKPSPTVVPIEVSLVVRESSGPVRRAPA